MVFPRVAYERLNHLFPVEKVTVFAEEHTSSAVKVLSLFLPQARVVQSNSALIRCTKDTTLGAEDYCIQLRPAKVRILFGDYTALAHALATLSLLFTRKDGLLFLPEGEVRDRPVFAHRGVMLDVARGVVSIDKAKQTLIYAALARMNVVHFHLSDSKGVAVRLNCLPSEMHLKGAYSPSQAAEISDLCRLLGLELIPEYDLPGHSTALLSAFPHLACEVPPKENERIWCACAGNEALYELYEKIINEICALFPHGKYFHIGGDELEFPLIDPPRYCHWDDCPRCKEKMKSEGLQDRRELYYYLMNRVHNMVKSHGRKTIMWSEQIDCARPCSLDKDIILQFWRVAYPGRGPVEHCSMARQLEMGYQIINSHYPETYVDLEKYMNTKTLASWRPDERPEVPKTYKTKILGSEVCAWEWGNTTEYPFYDRILPSCIFLMGDKLWSGRKEEYDENCAKALTRAILGADTPEGYNAFAEFGDLIPPRTDTAPLSLP